MSEPFIGEIRMFAGNYPPLNWAFCNGQLLSISSNETLFSILGTTYGGDGRVNFALPNLQGCVPMHFGTSPAGTLYVLGQTGGVESVTLNANQMPSHSHGVNSSGAGGTQASPVGGYPAVESTGTSLDYIPTATNIGAMNAGMIQNAGGGLAHENRQPFLCVSFIIALSGIFPSRS
jgi:microcystin-dependent protein